MSANPLPLSIIADVTVITSSPQVSSPQFNTPLVIGSTAAIPSYGVNPRVRIYLKATYSTQMITDGFSLSSPEYICAQIIFSQSPSPSQIAVGRQDLTAIGTAVQTTGNAGINYKVGDIITVTQSGASNGQLRVTSIGTGGVVTGLAIIVGAQGTSYTPANGLSTTGGSGTGLEVNVLTSGETAVEAAAACRAANSIWYPFMLTTAQPADHVALAAWAQGQIGTVYFGTDNESNAVNGISPNTFSTIYGATSSRTWMQYATTQGGLYPNQVYFVAAVMGQAMASNTQLANSNFTEKFSGGVPLVGVYTEPLSTTQIANIESFGGNLFLNYGNAFNILEQGSMMAPGVFFDSILGLDVLGSNIQYNILNLLTTSNVPQTDAGQQLLVQAVEKACAQSALTGFIAPGVWRGNPINIGAGLVNGQSLPNGYIVLTQKYADIPLSQIAARIAPAIYVGIIEGGNVHFVTIAVIAQV
jgi:hypothetical protein